MESFTATTVGCWAKLGLGVSRVAQAGVNSAGPVAGLAVSPARTGSAFCSTNLSVSRLCIGQDFLLYDMAGQCAPLQRHGPRNHDGFHRLRPASKREF